MTERLRVLKIGQKARALLRLPAGKWNVLAAVSDAVYVSSEDGELLWVTDRPRALHTRAVLLSAMPRVAPAAGSVLKAARGLLAGTGLRLAWHDEAEVWMPLKVSTEDRLVAGFHGRVRHAIRRAMKLSLETGRLSREVARSDRRIRGGGVAGAARATMARSIAALSRVATGCELLPALLTATELVGLGEGLTPAGDDILGGYLYTLRMLDAAPGRRLAIDWAGVAAWVRSVEPRTNGISHCMLGDHARGDACAPLGDFVREALEGSSDARLAQLAVDVAGIGASSGWSLLAGVRVACHVARDPVAGAQRQRLTHESSGRPFRREVARVR